MKVFMEKFLKFVKGSKWLIVTDGIIAGVLLIIVIVFSFQYTSILSLRHDLSSLTKSFGDRISTLEADLATTTQVSRDLSKQLADQSSSLQDSLEDISDTVGTLEKLSKTDKELLQKYSRVYFLSDNYVPLSLEKIDSKYLDNPAKETQFHSSALSYLEDLIEAAARKDIDLKIVSAYRSFGTQSGLKASYLTLYGSGSNQFSADQGYSEHQLGTAVDLTVEGQDPDLTVSFELTPAFDWLTKNAYRYGFILSYPKGNAYYQYEPWHWRFVGKSLATKLHRDGINFSDMDQRDIDAYLVKIFD